MGKVTKDVLVVGGAGYLGNSVLNYLQTQTDGFLGRLAVLDNLIHEPMFRRNDITEFYGLDIEETELINDLISDFDTVIWLAGMVGDKACEQNPKLSEHSNVKSLENIKFDGRFIYISSCSVYGTAKTTDFIVDERTEPNPLSLYAKQKLKAEQIVAKKWKNSVILRLGTLFGFSDGFGRPRLDIAINNFIYQAFEKNSIRFFGGIQVRPFIHVKDVAHAIKRVCLGEPRGATGVYILSSFNMAIQDVVTLINSYFSDSLDLYFDNCKFEPRNYAANNDKAGNRGILNTLAYYTVSYAVEQYGDIASRMPNKNNPYFYN
jgi:nucleoside-diphosphate-sugar epimerase